MLDRIALNFAQLPSGYYIEAVLALPRTEERAGEVDTDYNELRGVLGKVLETMAPGGRIKVGQPGDQVIQEAILIGFLVEREHDQVFSTRLEVLTLADDPSQTQVHSSCPTPSKETTKPLRTKEKPRLFDP